MPKSDVEKDAINVDSKIKLNIIFSWSDFAL